MRTSIVMKSPRIIPVSTATIQLALLNIEECNVINVTSIPNITPTERITFRKVGFSDLSFRYFNIFAEAGWHIFAKATKMNRTEKEYRQFLKNARKIISIIIM